MKKTEEDTNENISHVHELEKSNVVNMFIVTKDIYRVITLS